MRPPSSLPAGSRRSAERPRPCATCARSARGLVSGICAVCRGRQEECLRRARASLEPDPHRSACGLCDAPIDSGYYCPACQPRASAAVAAYERQERLSRRR